MTNRRAASIRKSSETEEQARPQPGTLSCLTALVASSDQEMLDDLVPMIVQCGLACFPAVTVAEIKRILDQQEVCLVVCDDRLTDGDYEDVLLQTARSRLNVPVVVVSPTGDWSDYLKASVPERLTMWRFRRFPEISPGRSVKHSPFELRAISNTQ